MKQTESYNFVYITTNLINGHQYIGDRTCTYPDEDKYLGSGTLFTLKLKEYGRENFKREILEFFSSKNEAFNAQEEYIKKFNTLVPNGYNISPMGGIGVSGCHSEKTKLKIGIKSKGRKHTEESKQKISIANTGKIKSIETREKLSKSNKGKIRSNETRERISQSKDHRGEKNPMFGRKHTKESKEKNRMSHIGKPVNGKLSGQTRLGKKRGKYKTKNDAKSEIV